MTRVLTSLVLMGIMATLNFVRAQLPLSPSPPPPVRVFAGLATDQSGAVLYFSSLPTPLGQTAPGHEKIVRWDRQTGFRVRAAVENSLDVFRTSAYMLKSPQVAWDESVIAYTGYRGCLFPSSFGACRSDTTPETTIERAGLKEPALVLRGEGRLSSNGRWASGFPADDFLNNRPLRFDLETGEQTPIQQHGFAVITAQVLDDGRIFTPLLYANDFVGYAVWKDGDVTIKNPVLNTTVKGISADGKIVSVVRDPLGTAAPGEVLVVEEPTGRVTSIAPSGQQPVLSRDGSMILFLDRASAESQRQLILARTDGSEKWQITDIAEGVQEGVLSGDGRVVFGLTNFNRLFRYEVDSGEIEFLTPSTPPLLASADVVLEAAQGAEIVFSASGFGDFVLKPDGEFPAALAGIQLRAGDTNLAFTAVSPFNLSVHVPYDLAPGTYPFAYEVSNHPFALPRSNLRVVSFAPQFLSGGCFCLLHAASRKPVRFDDPAVPGESLYLDVTGLGAVSPMIASGTPAPEIPRSHVLKPLRAELSSTAGKVPLTILDAFVLPGTAGRYRVELQVPMAAADAQGYGLGGTFRLWSDGERNEVQAVNVLFVKLR